MPFSPRFLNDHEEIVLDLHPHWWFFGPSALSLAAVLVVVTWLQSLVSGWVQTWLTYLGLGVIIVTASMLVVELIKWRTTYFVVTSQRVIYRQGVVARTGIEIPLERVANVNFSQGIVERILGVGDIVIQSGGEDGDQTFSDIKSPATVQNYVIRAIQNLKNYSFDGAPSLSGIAHELERLEALRDRGTLTEAEFEEQKRRLLG